MPAAGEVALHLVALLQREGRLRPDTKPWKDIVQDVVLMGERSVVAEQIEGKPADARADLFSFCVALYEGLYGARPFGGETLQELRVEIAAGRVRPPRSGST